MDPGHRRAKREVFAAKVRSRRPSCLELCGIRFHERSRPSCPRGLRKTSGASANLHFETCAARNPTATPQSHSQTETPRRVEKAGFVQGPKYRMLRVAPP